MVHDSKKPNLVDHIEYHEFLEELVKRLDTDTNSIYSQGSYNQVFQSLLLIPFLIFLVILFISSPRLFHINAFKSASNRVFETCSPKSLCECLRGKYIVVIGDSINRNVVSNLIKYTSGGRNTTCILKTNTCNSQKPIHRRCHARFIQCQQYLVYSICGDIKLIYLDSWLYERVHYQKRTLHPMEDILAYFNISMVDVIIGGHVLHEFRSSHLETERYINTFFNELRKLSRTTFWLSVHKRNMTLVPNANQWQINARARRKSLIAKKIAEKYDDVEYLEAFNTSEDGLTHDGTHYGYDVNVKKISIFFDAYCKHGWHGT